MLLLVPWVFFPVRPSRLLWLLTPRHLTICFALPLPPTTHFWLLTLAGPALGMRGLPPSASLTSAPWLRYVDSRSLGLESSLLLLIRVRPLSRSLGLSRRLRNPVGPVGGSTKRSLRMPKSPTVARGLLEEWVVVGAEEL